MAPLPLRSRLLPSNQDISFALIERYRKLVIGTSVKMSNKYHFSLQDREDLVSHVHAKICAVDWVGKIRANRAWIEANYRRPCPWRPWTMPEVFKVVGGYTVTLITNSMIDAARRIAACGLSGLGKKSVGEFPFHNDSDYDPASEDVENPFITSELLEMAARILPPRDWTFLTLHFGFHDGKSHTPEQIAKLHALPREEVREAITGAIRKLRSHVGIPEVDG